MLHHPQVNFVEDGMTVGTAHVRRPVRGVAVAAMLLGLVGMTASVRGVGQTAPAAPATASASSQRGTVKGLAGSTLTLTTDAGKEVTVTVGDGARIVQIAPGSTDLKTATAIKLVDIAAGDRVLVTGKAADAAGALTATRVVLMKSADIAEKRTAQQADWNRRGSGGIVSAVDAATGALTVTNGAKKTQILTTGTTIFRRYAGDSVKFEDAQPGTLAQIQPGDQVRVRGAKSEDGASIQAEEIVSGSFRNLAGTVVSASADTVTLKDLATKKNVVVKVTANSNFRKLPPQAAAMFAMRAKGGAGAPGGEGAGGGHGASTGSPGGEGGPGQRGPGGPGGPGAGGPGGGRGNLDLSQMIARLPEGSLTELKAGDALMIVASQTGGTTTAITMLSGVEAILAASPTGSAPAVTISPFGFGGGAPEGGGGAPQ